MMLFRLLSWPYVRQHKIRTVLTTMGIVIGVAVFVAMHTANQAVLAMFQDTLGRIAEDRQQGSASNGPTCGAAEEAPLC